MTTVQQKNCLIIFAKAPVEGEVNTRLIPDIGVGPATELQRDLIFDRASMFAGMPVFDTVLCCAPDDQHEVFQQCRDEYDVELSVQQGGDLGERMSNALETACREYDSMVLIGTDAPMVDSSIVGMAFEHLRAVDVVLQPAEDGGYVLIGMNDSHPAVFHAVPWGSDRVLTKTRANIVASGLRWQELDTGWDIDTLEDYERYRNL